jgi:hypothetical protein
MTGRIVFALALCAVAACGGDPSGPAFRPDALATPDSFRFRAAGLDRTSDTLTYTWNNPLDSARIIHTSAVTAGSGTLTVRSPGGLVLYESSVATSGTFGIMRSIAGPWSVEIRLTAIKGSFEFRIEALP